MEWSGEGGRRGWEERSGGGEEEKSRDHVLIVHHVVCVRGSLFVSRCLQPSAVFSSVSEPCSFSLSTSHVSCLQEAKKKEKRPRKLDKKEVVKGKKNKHSRRILVGRLLVLFLVELLLVCCVRQMRQIPVISCLVCCTQHPYTGSG